MNNFLLRIALAFLLVAGTVALTAPTTAQQGNPDPRQPGTTQRQAEPQDGTQTQDAKPFNGIIMKEKGKLILKDTTTKVNYQLDDQDKAKAFVGKQVKVTGKLDLETNLIHVESIELMES